MSRFTRLVAAAVLTAAAGLAVPLPAQAAACPTTTGVTVVVNFDGVGGGIETTCVPGGGGDSAGSLFEVHHNLTRTSRFPGAVCKVDGLPGDAACQAMPPADAYWGLFWSDDGSGWAYSSEGVDSLNIPDGGSVAFAWQNGGGTDAPGVPPNSPEEPTPDDPEPTDDGSGGGDKGGGSGGGKPGQPGSSESPSAGTPSESAAPDEQQGSEKSDKAEEADKPDKNGKGDKADEETETPDAEATETTETTEAEDAEATAEPPADGGDGLPGWVAPAGIAVLFAAAGAVALVRRRTSP